MEAGCVASDLIHTVVGARCERLISCFEAKSAGYTIAESPEMKMAGYTLAEIKEGITRIGPPNCCRLCSHDQPTHHSPPRKLRKVQLRNCDTSWWELRPRASRRPRRSRTAARITRATSLFEHLYSIAVVLPVPTTVSVNGHGTL